METLSNPYHYEKAFWPEPMKLDNLSLIQLGMTHSHQCYTVFPHVHGNCFELTHAMDGKGVIFTNGIEIPIRAGETYLSFPGDIHGITSDREEPLKFAFFAFRLESGELSEIFEQIIRLHNDPSKRIFIHQGIENLISNGISELILDDPYSHRLLSSIANQLVCYIIREFAGDRRNTKLRVGTPQELCYQMMNYINTHIYGMTNLTELSDYCGYSYSYLSDVFRKTTGETLADYHTERRMEVSVMLMQQNQYSVSQIAQMLQYSSIYSFSRSFKKHFGLSPTQYRKQRLPIT